MSVHCEAVDTSAGVCETVYYYEKKIKTVCTDSAHPYLGADDMCYKVPQ
jgi:hypothetical protein